MRGIIFGVAIRDAGRRLFGDSGFAIRDADCLGIRDSRFGTPIVWGFGIRDSGCRFIWGFGIRDSGRRLSSGSGTRDLRVHRLIAGAVAARVVAAAPEGLSLLSAFLDYALEHRFATFGAEWCIG